jgi:Tol biopolymer transport system component
MSSIRRTRSAWLAALATLAAGFADAGLRAQEETARESVDSAGSQANDDSWRPELSSDGLVVAFDSPATNLVAGDTNGQTDCFVRDRVTGIVELVSVDSSGTQGDAMSEEPRLSADGRYVVFTSFATNLVAGDTNGHYDAFVHDRVTGVTERVSVDSSGVEGDGDSAADSISSDGNLVLFQSLATQLVAGDTNGAEDLFVRDRAAGTTTRVSLDSNGAEAHSSSWAGRMTPDGRSIAFTSSAANLVKYDSNGVTDVFHRDLSTGVTTRVSVDSSGKEGNSYSFMEGMSSDGRWIVFSSTATNLVAGDTNGHYDVFLHDRSNGVTERVSIGPYGAQGDWDSSDGAVSDDGSLVAFSSGSTKFVAGDTNNACDVFLRDRNVGRTRLVSVASDGTQGDDISDAPALSADGSVVAFESVATTLVQGDTNAVPDIFSHELCLSPATWSNYGSGWPGTNGVPAFTCSKPPQFGAFVIVQADNSSGVATTGMLFLGFQRANITTTKGGDLLVVPALVAPVAIPTTAFKAWGTIPDNDAFCGVVCDLQVLELDPGASQGVSFTAGLELVIGR